ncbi:hypothetical protein [Paenibacillus tyrfis]|uniref:hypothetical protein n=1 Tax=Paenibacillus tyrfis TaxID=1501230 RepID=UPI00209D4B07|nr:hypothetical protein [Paenibacillus tyrfis]MCP1309843.1 hypothetical protein [Paenibacillus tyrfis]
MADKIVLTFLTLPIIAWGVLSLLKPELALKYTLGMLHKHIKPNRYFIYNIKISGVAYIIGGVWILFFVWTGRMGV